MNDTGHSRLISAEDIERMKEYERVNGIGKHNYQLVQAAKKKKVLARAKKKASNKSKRRNR